MEDENNPGPEDQELSTPEVDQEVDEVEEAEAPEVVEEADDGQSEDDEYDEIEWEDGKKYAVPKALKDGVMRQADYTRKTQEVAEQRKAIEADRVRFNEAVQLQQHGLEKMAELRLIESQIKEYQNVDWDRLQEDDPQAYMRHDRIYRGLVQKQQETTADYQRTVGEVQQRQRAERAKAVQENQRIVAERIPDWSPEKARALREYALGHGLSESEVNSVYLAPHIELLHKAMMFDQLQKQKPVKPKPEAAKPVERIRPKANKASKDPAKMSMDEYAAWRRAGNG